MSFWLQLLDDSGHFLNVFIVVVVDVVVAVVKKNSVFGVRSWFLAPCPLLLSLVLASSALTHGEAEVVGSARAAESCMPHQKGRRGRRQERTAALANASQKPAVDQVSLSLFLFLSL